MNDFSRVGLLINPRAGKGFAFNAQIAREVIARLGPAHIFTGPGELGAGAFGQSEEPAITVCETISASGREQSQTLVANILRNEVSALIVVSGDGTMADVAAALVREKAATPLLGIGVGSTNVGNLVTCRVGEIERLTPAAIRVAPLQALTALEGDKVLGIGFNDCVLGFSVVGTIAGVCQDVDAAGKMSGQDLPGRAQSIGTPETLVERIGPCGVDEVARGAWVAVVAVGFAEKSFFGKAVTGGVCLASWTQVPAGCLVSSFPLVQVDIRRDEVMQMDPVRSAFVAVDETTRIRVRGVRPGTAVCVDGNPLKILGENDAVEFGVSLEAVRSFQFI